MKKIVSDRLKQCRIDAGLTQWEVAVYCDISDRTYQNYELMRREPRLEILVRIADVLNVSLDYLAGRTNQKQIPGQIIENDAAAADKAACEAC